MARTSNRIPPPPSQCPVPNAYSGQLTRTHVLSSPYAPPRLLRQAPLSLHAGEPRDAGPAAAVSLLRTPCRCRSSAHGQLSATGAPIRNWQRPSSPLSAAPSYLRGSAAASCQRQWARQPTIPTDRHAAQRINTKAQNGCDKQHRPGVTTQKLHFMQPRAPVHPEPHRAPQWASRGNAEPPSS